MNTLPPTPSPVLTEDVLHAYVDGRLGETERAAIAAALAQDPENAATVAAWQRQREQLRTLHRPLLNEPVPAALLNTAAGLQTRRDAAQRAWRWAGMAASLVLVFGLGWLSHSALHPGTGDSGYQQATHGQQEFIRQAALAYSVYSPEVRHPVEVAAAQQEHLVQWLSKRVGRPLKVPNLSAQGYELVGGRLLPGDGGARAQFMFQNSQGERVTLYLGAVTPLAGQPGSPSSGQAGAMAVDKQTAFQFTSEVGVSSFYWVDQGFGYALAGKLPREGLLKLAEVVYPQL